MHKLPAEIVTQYNQQKKEYKHSWVGFNAELNKYVVYMFPFGWLKPSLIITKIEL